MYRTAGRFSRGRWMLVALSVTAIAHGSVSARQFTDKQVFWRLMSAYYAYLALLTGHERDLESGKASRFGVDQGARSVVASASTGLLSRGCDPAHARFQSGSAFMALLSGADPDRTVASTDASC
jgi:hypothetical protein